MNEKLRRTNERVTAEPNVYAVKNAPIADATRSMSPFAAVDTAELELDDATARPSSAPDITNNGLSCE